MTESPDKILLGKILKKIEESHIISESVLARYRKSIQEGTMTAEDWCLLAEPIDADMKEQ
ncbi:MAG: hypothetical protein B6D34_03505 [Candidatus Brocadia sp. UTAMX1]|jgi:hypothetical protein|nr:MAG: hypothetical protein B6D34_03505 [Candidatus Brocadia sp. UTAMX1]